MVVEVEGELNKTGMIIDFYDLGKIIKPIVEKYDHAFLCFSGDKVIKDFLIKNKMKHVIADYYSTVENICTDFSSKIVKGLKQKKFNNIKSVTVKISETPNSVAEMTLHL